MKINEFLVKSMSISHKEAVSLIRNTKIFVNTKPAAQKQLISFQDQIVFEEKILQNAGAFFYYAYYKPYGIECTMNENIPDNLPQAVAIPKPFFPIGRLDKNSEGLLILTNDGNTYEKVANASKFKEKEYIVTVDKELSEEVIQKLATGITIMGKKTRPAEVKKITDSVFTIILTQGLNRQIRRMCYKLGYNVLSLKRIRIMTIELGNLKPGEFFQFKKEMLFADQPKSIS